MPSPALAADLVRWAVPSPVAEELAPGRALPVTVASGSLPDGRRAWFVFNWGWEPQAITLAASVAEHRLIAAAIAARDADLAAHATHVHLHNALATILASVDGAHSETHTEISTRLSSSGEAAYRDTITEGAP